MIEASTQFIVGRLSTESGKCRNFNLDGIVGNDTEESFLVLPRRDKHFSRPFGSLGSSRQFSDFDSTKTGPMDYWRQTAPYRLRPNKTDSIPYSPGCGMAVPH